MFLLEAASQGKPVGEAIAGAEAAAAARWFQHAPDVAVPETFSREEELEYELMRPEMPIILAHARGMLRPPPSGDEPSDHQAAGGVTAMQVEDMRIVPLSNFDLVPTGLMPVDPEEHASLLGAGPSMSHFGMAQQGMFLQGYGASYHEGDHGNNYHLSQQGY